MKFATAAAALFLGAGAVAAQEPATLSVATEPPGATLILDGIVVGIAPAVVVLSPRTERSVLVLEKEGFSAAEVELDYATLPPALDVSLDVRRSTIPVTVAEDIPPRPDGLITLREALEYAAGERRPAGADRVLIDGPVGAGRPDDIVIAVEGLGESPVLTVRSPLPAMSDDGDRLIGPEQRASLAPAFGVEIRGPGIRLVPGTLVAGMIVDGFDVGIEAAGFGTAEARDVTALGGQIGFSAVDGAELLLNGASAITGFAAASAIGDGIVDGFVDPIPFTDRENMTMLSGAAGEPGYAIVEGWLPVGADTGLYVRRPERIPLSEVEGLDAISTSYEAFRIFGGEGYQHWPHHVFDGPGGDYFQWEFIRAPQDENLVVNGRRPMRAESFTVNHLEGESRLIRYKFSLLSRYGGELAEYEIEADPVRDVIAVDPEIDFFGFRIDIVESLGSTPGITEIEADILDSIAYQTISASQRRVVFPRPAEGSRAVVELAGRLLAVESDAFSEFAQFPLRQGPGPTERPRAVVALPADANSSDLTNALASLDPDLPGDIVISGDLRLDTVIPPISHRDLRLRGGGRIAGEVGTPLVFNGLGQATLEDLTLTGIGLTLLGGATAQLSGVTFRDFDTAITGEYGYLIANRTRFENGNIAVSTVGGSVTMSDSVIEGVVTGITSRASEPLTLAAVDIAASERAVDRRPEGGFAAVTNLIASTALPAHLISPELAPARFSRESIVGDNDPPALGLPTGNFDVRNRSWNGEGVIDLRDGTGVTGVRVVTAEGENVRCLLLSERAPRVLRGRSWVVLQDSDVLLRCHDGNAGAAVGLPMSDFDATANPATATVAIGLGASLSPGEEGLFEGVDAQVRWSALGSGQAFPPLGSEDTASRRSAIVQALVDAGDHAQAFGQAYQAFMANPREPVAGDTLSYVASNWATALEDQGRYQDAEDLLADLADGSPSPPGIDGRLVASLAGHAAASLDAGAWAEARALYRRVLDRRPELEVARNNVIFSYQEQILEGLAPESAQETIAWVEAEIAAYPDMASDIREVAALGLNNAVVGALNDGAFAAGLVLAATHFDWEPTDRTRNNLRVAFQEFALDAVGRGAAEEALEELALLEGRLGADLDLSSIAVNVFGAEAQRAIDAGDTTRAVSAARALYGAAPSADSAELLAYVHARHGEALASREGPLAGLDVLAGAIADYPEIDLLRDQARILGNNAAIDAYDAGNREAAIATIERTLELAPGAEGLLNNLRVFYINWAVDLANAGDLARALEIAQAGLKRFPGDTNLNSVVEFATRNR